MIKVTEEMVRAAQAATSCEPAECDECMAKALAAVLAILERDLGMVGPCSASLPYLFDTEFATFCELRHGHSGDHKAGPTRWRELL